MRKGDTATGGGSEGAGPRAEPRSRSRGFKYLKTAERPLFSRNAFSKPCFPFHSPPLVLLSRPDSAASAALTLERQSPIRRVPASIVLLLKAGLLFSPTPQSRLRFLLHFLPSESPIDLRRCALIFELRAREDMRGCSPGIKRDEFRWPNSKRDYYLPPWTVFRACGCRIDAIQNHLS